jgi:hypothetical protein
MDATALFVSWKAMSGRPWPPIRIDGVSFCGSMAANGIVNIVAA